MIRLSLSTPCSAPSSPSPSDQSPAMEYVLFGHDSIKSNVDQYSLFSLRQQARWWRGRVARGQRECREKKESAKEFKLRIIDYPITIYRVDQGDSLMSELTDSFIHCLNSPFSQHQILPFDV